MKAFLKTPGQHAAEYADLTVKFVPGKTPELFVYADNGTLTDGPIDLTKYPGLDELHALLEKKGFQKMQADDEL